MSDGPSYPIIAPGERYQITRTTGDTTMTHSTIPHAAIEAAVARARQERAATVSAMLLGGLRALRRVAAALTAGRPSVGARPQPARG